MVVPALPLRTLLLYAGGSASRTLSYQVGWPKAFVQDARFAVTGVDVAGEGALHQLASVLRTRRRYDLMVVLHSVTSQGSSLPPRMVRAIEGNSTPLAFFMGNEYKLIPEKLDFAEQLGTDLLISQTDDPGVLDLYSQRLGCPVVGIPGGGLDPDTFRPEVPLRDRTLDIGMRAHDEPIYFGHQDRRTIAAATEIAAARRGLKVDISFDPAQRLTPVAYAAFLNSCRSQLGTEGGTDYFDLLDETRHTVNAYVDAHPQAALDDLEREVFRHAEAQGCRMLTGRHVEAAATRTVQILFRGRYCSLFEPGVHYIPVSRDLSDLEQALDTLADDAACERIAGNAYDVVMAELTYTRLLDRFLDAVQPIL